VTKDKIKGGTICWQMILAKMTMAVI